MFAIFPPCDGYYGSMKQHVAIIRSLAAALAACAACSVGIARAECTAPTVSAAHVAGVSHDGGLNHYRIAMTITNTSDTAQPNNTLQFVDIRKTGNKIDAIGVPPLKSGASYTANYTFARSSDAGDNTTTLHFQIEMRQPQCSTTPAVSVTF